MTPLNRDFIGYGKTIPRVRWPKGARLALTFAINYEAGAERSVPFGDQGAETYGEFPAYVTPPKRDLAIESIFEYETRCVARRRRGLLKRYSFSSWT